MSSAVGYGDASGSALPVSVTVADVFALWLGLVGAAVRASRTRGTGSLVRDFGLRVGSVWDIVAGIVIGLGSQYVLVPLLYLPFEQIDHHLAHELSAPAHQETSAAHDPFQLVVLFVFLALGAPLVEELFFRGLLLRGLLARVPTAVAIILTGLLFGLAHFEPVQFAGLALFGMVLALVAWRTGRIGPTIAAHAAFNAAAVISLAHLH